MLTKTTTRKALFLIFFILFMAATKTMAQDEENTDEGSFEHNRSFYFGIHAGVVKDFGKQANYFRGLNPVFNIDILLSIPQVQSELYNRTGMNYTYKEAPGVMQYNVAIGPGVDLLYDAGDINYILSATTSKLTTSGVFTLGAINPANPYGEDLIKTETIEGVERRTWVKAGMQFKNAINERSDFYFELAPMLFFQKAVKNTVSIEGLNYSILVQNPGNVPVRTSYMGYGLNLGLGVLTRFKGNRMLQFGVNGSFSKLKMVNISKLNLMAGVDLSVFL